MATLRYSATHRNQYNLLYRLDPIRAYDLRLVSGSKWLGGEFAGLAAAITDEVSRKLFQRKLYRQCA